MANEGNGGDSYDVEISSDDEAGTDSDSSDHKDDVYAHSNSSDYDDVFWTDTDFSDDDDDGVTDERNIYYPCQSYKRLKPTNRCVQSMIYLVAISSLDRRVCITITSDMRCQILRLKRSFMCGF
jgi:hypothetical protein